MTGNIYYIERSWGVINGDDGKEYFFHKSELKNCTIFQLSDGDRVEFNAVIQPDQIRDRAEQVRKKDTIKNTQRAVVSPGINPAFIYSSYNDDEKKIIDNLQKVFYVTNGGNEIIVGQSVYHYCLVKPTESYVRAIIKGKSRCIFITI